MPTAAETSIWERLMETEKNDLAPEAAQYFLRLNFAPNDVERMNGLAEKARLGSLSEEENRLLDEYIQAGHLLSLLKSKARVSLRNSGHAC